MATAGNKKQETNDGSLFLVLLAVIDHILKVLVTVGVRAAVVVDVAAAADGAAVGALAGGVAGGQAQQSAGQHQDSDQLLQIVHFFTSFPDDMIKIIAWFQFIFK